MNWNYLCRNTNISVDFFERYLSLCKQHGEQDKIDWYALSTNTNIPVEFFDKYKDKIDWSTLSSNTNIPYQFFLPGGRETVKNTLMIKNIKIKLIGIIYQEIKIFHINFSKII